MSKIQWTQQAINDLNKILEYIAEDARSPENAHRVYNELNIRLERLRDHDETGSRHEHAIEAWRYILFKRWLIFFRRDANGIAIMRMIDGARDLPRHL